MAYKKLIEPIKILRDRFAPESRMGRRGPKESSRPRGPRRPRREPVGPRRALAGPAKMEAVGDEDADHDGSTTGTRVPEGRQGDQMASEAAGL